MTTPFGPYYPLVLDPVMRHAERMAELLMLRERLSTPGAPGHAWLSGRAAELRCVALVLGRDWHDGRLSAGAAAIELAHYLRRNHDELAQQLNLERPSCCHIGFPSLAFTRGDGVRDMGPARPASTG
jgi:hypothetical protein